MAGRPVARRPDLLVPRRLSAPPPWALAALLAAVVLVLEPRGADLAAQSYRVGLWERAGFTVWDNGWYSGHHVPAYSLLFPPLGALLGVRVAGALAVVAAAWAFTRLTAGRPGASAAAYAFAVAVVSLTVSGRLTFALGTALALGALWAARGRRPAVALALAALTPAASPVAGAFLALALAAWWIGDRGARQPLTVALAAAASLPAVVLGALFPEGGTFPFATSSFGPALAATLALAAVVPREQPVLRAGVLLTAALLVAAWAVPSPMGGNAVRLGALALGPVALLTLWAGPRRGALLLLGPVAAWLCWGPPADDWLRSSDDPTTRARAYVGLKAFLAAQDGPPFRVEVPFTDNHWESALLAPTVPLARGWERQYDREVNALFYENNLSSARYERWLRDNAVRFVALADAPVDYSAAREADIVRARPAFLAPVYRDAVWQVFEVRGAPTIGVTRLHPDGFTARGGRTVRVRFSPWFVVTGGSGCVFDDDGWTGVRGPGTVEVRARVTLRGATRRNPPCR